MLGERRPMTKEVIFTCNMFSSKEKRVNFWINQLSNSFWEMHMSLKNGVDIWHILGFSFFFFANPFYTPLDLWINQDLLTFENNCHKSISLHGRILKTEKYHKTNAENTGVRFLWYVSILAIWASCLIWPHLLDLILHLSYGSVPPFGSLKGKNSVIC